MPVMTSHAPGTFSWADLAAFRRAHSEGRLRTRIYAAVPLATWERLRDTVAARRVAALRKGRTEHDIREAVLTWVALAHVRHPSPGAKDSACPRCDASSDDSLKRLVGM